MRGRVADIIICFKFYRNRLRGFRAARGQNGGLPLTLIVALTTGQHYRAACDGKSQTGFRLVPTSVTSYDLQWRNSPYFALLHRIP